MSDVNDKLAKLLLYYSDKPILFAKQVCNMQLTKQQEALITVAARYESRVACKSATGTGKTTTLAILIFHQLCTQPDCKIIATSPSAGQLERGLRSELEKIHNLMEPDFKDLFELMSDVIYVKGKKKTQFCSLVTGSASNKESLAGVHADKVLIVVDEASAISEEIYDTLVGNLTTAGSSLVQTSNPVRSSGPFYNLWANPENMKIWTLLTFTAFDAPRVADSWIELVKAEYGDDSDFYRMRVLGEFPKASSESFIRTADAEEAIKHISLPGEYKHFPKVMGVDVARFGDDATVFVLRQGPKILDIEKIRGLDTMEVSARVVEYYHLHQPSTIYIDAIGIGAGVFDRCKELKLPVVDVIVSSKPNDPKRYSNLRSELWGLMREWLKNGADIPNDLELKNQLISMQYGYNSKMQIQLMSKRDLKKKLGLESPDIPDAISLTMAASTFTYSPRRAGIRKVVKSKFLWC